MELYGGADLVRVTDCATGDGISVALSDGGRRTETFWVARSDDPLAGVPLDAATCRAGALFLRQSPYGGQMFPLRGAVFDLSALASQLTLTGEPALRLTTLLERLSADARPVVEAFLATTDEG